MAVPAAATPTTFTLTLGDGPAEPHNGAVASLRVNGEGGQRRILRACLDHFIVVCAFGRSFGKTLTAFFLFWEEFRQFGVTLWSGEKTYDFAYCAPTRANHAIKEYRKWKELLAPLITWHSDVELTLHIQLKEKKAILDFWGLDEHDSHRGARKHRIVIDEVKDVVRDAFSATLMPMTLGRQGKMLLQGTPGRWGKGNAWFKEVFRLGQAREDGYYSLTAPSHDNPKLTVAEIDRLKAACGDEKTVREEIYAEWLSDEGAVFSNLRATFSVPVKATYRWSGFAFLDEPAESRPNLWVGEEVDKGTPYREPDKYVAGLDFGIKDSTVLTVFNRRTNQQAAVARFSGHTDYTEIIPALDKLMDWWNWPLVVYDEGGGHGGAVREYLAREYKQGITGRRWSFKSKVADITRAQFLCSKAGTDDGWGLIDVPWQKAEFEAYEVVTKTKQGMPIRPRFGAPANMNDDSVTAACIAATVLSATYTPAPKKAALVPFSHDYWNAYAKMMTQARGRRGR